MNVRGTLAKALRATARAARWTAECFADTVTSAAGKLDGNAARQITARVVATAVAAGGTWAAVKDAMTDKDVVMALITTAGVFVLAFLEALRRHQSPPTVHAAPPPPNAETPGDAQANA